MFSHPGNFKQSGHFIVGQRNACYSEMSKIKRVKNLRPEETF